LGHSKAIESFGISKSTLSQSQAGESYEL